MEGQESKSIQNHSSSTAAPSRENFQELGATNLVSVVYPVSRAYELPQEFVHTTTALQLFDSDYVAGCGKWLSNTDIVGDVATFFSEGHDEVKDKGACLRLCQNSPGCSAAVYDSAIHICHARQIPDSLVESEHLEHVENKHTMLLCGAHSKGQKSDSKKGKKEPDTWPETNFGFLEITRG